MRHAGDLTIKCSDPYIGNMTYSAQDDRHKTLDNVMRLRRSSLVSELRFIQKHALPVEKAHQWAKDLLCLRYDASHSPCFRKFHNYSTRLKFVAVSWTREPSLREDPRWGKYSVLPMHGKGSSETTIQPQTLHVRDVVLDRVVSYLEAYKLDTFWIDKACIDQKDSKRKTRAINSMDLVYKKADKSVGLLSSRIYSSSGARMLGALLDGHLSDENNLGQCQFRPGACDRTIAKVIGVIRDVTGDPWWKRAWIYQEEYLSGICMDLLIPVDAGVYVPLPYGRVPGEFCVRATTLRKQVTIFLLAYLAIDGNEHNAQIREMLAVVERYSITLKNSAGVLKPMSVKISTDIAQRSAKNAWDTIAITANACAYNARLDILALQRRGCSLSLCLLAQFLLNGEIFTNTRICDKVGYKPLNHNISVFMEKFQLEFEDLPTSTGALTFLKYCRLPSTRILAEGLGTRGYIWFLPKHASIDTSALNLPKLSGTRREYLEDHPWDSLELEMLVDELEQGDQALLGAELRLYLKKRRINIASPALAFMDVMACKLFQAIDRGLTVRYGFLPDRHATGIFIPHAWELKHSMHVLTTWQPPRRGINEVGNAVSLKISLRANRIVSPLRWIDGMVFFSSKDIDAVILGWPRSWMKRPAKIYRKLSHYGSRRPTFDASHTS
jgi:hypothetical protein